jgi:UDP-N-acetylglucosamine 2-epimerase (non-hydrolysing)
MRESSFLITDSGGIQEEAPSLGRKVLVAREDTERNECVDSGFGIMVGTDKNEIIRQATKLLEKKDCTCVPQDVYGKGNASKKIVEIIKSGIMNGSQEN